MVAHSGKYKKGKNTKRHNYKKPKSKNVVPDKKKKISFIQRGRQTETSHRKQKIIEDNYREQAVVKDDYQFLDDTGAGNDHLDQNSYEQLISTFKTADTIDTEDESESDSIASGSDEETDQESEEIEDEEEIGVEMDTSMTANSDCEPKKHLNLDLFEKNQRQQCLKQNDTFSMHLDYEISSDMLENLLATSVKTKETTTHWPVLGTLNLETPVDVEKTLKSIKPTAITCSADLESLGVQTSLASHIPVPLSALQTELFTLMHNYMDVFYPHRTLEQADELRQVYCLHALNHTLKTRSRIIHHNAKLKSAGKKSAIIPDSYRDQGLVRPKVLILAPFRDAAFRIVNTLTQLLFGSAPEACKSNGSLSNYERFVEEFTGNTIYFSKTNPKPEDYEKTFCGNTDDNFRIGLALTKKSLKLYTDFYESDIMIASPLGLRLKIGVPGAKEHEYDFLNSIELLVIDQAEQFFAQNWENLLHVVEHMHLQPQSLRDTDFQRVRSWCLNGQSRFYRQTLLLTTHELPEFRGLFNNKCANYGGKVHITNAITNGDIRNVIVPISQVFQRFDVPNLESLFDMRFQYFINEVLPRFRNPSFAHCMIYVPSYFDYVRLRNYFKEQTINFVQICEYTTKPKIARARDMFFHSGAHFLLYSERAHFFRRTRLKGVRHLIMYQPPMWPHFYSELINSMQDSNQNARDGLKHSMSITVLYSKYDLLQLNAILGSETALSFMKSNKHTRVLAAE